MEMNGDCIVVYAVSAKRCDNDMQCKSATGTEWRVRGLLCVCVSCVCVSVFFSLEQRGQHSSN